MHWTTRLVVGFGPTCHKNGVQKIIEPRKDKEHTFTTDGWSSGHELTPNGLRGEGLKFGFRNEK